MLLIFVQSIITFTIHAVAHGGRKKGIKKNLFMKLKNDFKQEDKIRVWVDHPYCAMPNCHLNDNCSIHHILGRSSSSIYNGIMLCGMHHKWADTMNTGSEQNLNHYKLLLQIAARQVIKSNYKDKPEDEEFLIKNAKYYDVV